MAYTNPERTQYRECALWVGCSFRGMPGQICVLCWVDNDFALARGWFMGFPKKLGVTHLTEHHPLNPAMGPLGPGTRLKAYVCAHGERLIEATTAIERRIRPTDLPAPMGLPIFNIRHFPSAERKVPAAVLELVRLGTENVRYGAELWARAGGAPVLPLGDRGSCAARAGRGARRLPLQLRLQFHGRRGPAPVGVVGRGSRAAATRRPCRRAPTDNPTTRRDHPPGFASRACMKDRGVGFPEVAEP